MHHRFVLALLPLLLSACAAGSASFEIEQLSEQGLVRFVFQTEGKNSFTVGTFSCDAPRGGTCTVDVPIAELQGGWNEVEVETRRRTGADEPLTARFFVGDEGFRRDCSVAPAPGTDGLFVDVTCRFDEGFGGEILGEPMEGGAARVRVSSLLEDSKHEGLGVQRPLFSLPIPLVVTNRGGGRWSRPTSAVVPLPLVQLEVRGAEPTWFEEILPLEVRVEAGAEARVNGIPVPGADSPRGKVHRVALEPGPNSIRVEGVMEGRVPAVVDLVVRGDAPSTPLFVDSPTELSFTTDSSSLQLRGRTAPEAKLYLGSRPVEAARDGSFDLNVPLEEGSNEIELLAVVDPGVRVVARPPTHRLIQVTYEPNPQRELREFRKTLDPEQVQETLDGMGSDPWRFTGRDVQFGLLVETVATSLVDSQCMARIEGIGCTHEVEAAVEVGFEARRAVACDGAQVPSVVEIARCTGLGPGDRIEVFGTVRGGLGGRLGELTVERPRIEAVEVIPAPWLVPTGEGRR